MSKVFLIPATRNDSKEELGRKVEALWQAAGLATVLGANDLTALKLHVGEPGCETFAPPAVAAALVRCIGKTGATPFLTDTAVLYKSPRDNGVGHTLVAAKHGFGLAEMGAPFLPADGLNGDEAIELPIEGKHFKKVAIASAIIHARSMIVLSHATGHLGTGYGGALKNLGMGCSAKKAKMQQHHGHQPRINAKRCTACGNCAAWCPADAIAVDEYAVINPTLCLGCGECIAICRDDAVTFRWGVAGNELQERVVEHAAAVMREKAGHIGFVTVACNMTKDCDCMGQKQAAVTEDIGLLAGFDPVALDAAVRELVRARAGQTLDALSYPRHDASVQLAYAEALGVGQQSYELCEVAL